MSGADAVDVLLVDDHPVLRHGLAALLGVEPWVATVHQAASVREGAALGAVERPAVAVVDLGLPDGNGAELVRRLRRVPGCPVLVLTMDRDGASVRTCLDAGASGYVLKDSAPDVVVRAVRTVLDGGLVLGPEVSGVLRGSTATPPPFDRLSPSDLRLTGLVAAGRTNGEIAVDLGIAVKTVRNRVAALLAALGAADRLQLALLAREKGVADPGHTH